jgi:hypothetical protein
VGNSLWHEYPIPTDFENQKRIIRALREWIQQLERDGLIGGFAFNHYYTPEGLSELRVRFQYSNEQNREQVENQLDIEVKKFLTNYALQEREWGSDTTDRHILQAYELGSRWVFLAWQLIEEGRFPAEYFSSAEFQFHFNHGVMNSLGIPKIPDEFRIHVNNIMDATGCRNKETLIAWLQSHLT